MEIGEIREDLEVRICAKSGEKVFAGKDLSWRVLKRRKKGLCWDGGVGWFCATSRERICAGRGFWGGVFVPR